MIAPFANLFGYILNFIYNIVNNYGLAIIIFSILIKIILLPLSIKQQKTMKKTTKIQNKLKEIQFKYKNDPENLNRATMELYKTENMSPFSGCFSGIVQIILLFAVFYLVRSPLTYMKKIDANIINPRIIGNSLEISPLLVIFSVTVGGAYFGMIGMFLAVPVAAVIKLILEDFVNNDVN